MCSSGGLEIPACHRHCLGLGQIGCTRRSRIHGEICAPQFLCTLQVDKVLYSFEELSWAEENLVNNSKQTSKGPFRAAKMSSCWSSSARSAWHGSSAGAEKENPSVNLAGQRKSRNKAAVLYHLPTHLCLVESLCVRRKVCV